jgi:tetratricopeptide (TPR) repeat protein
LGHSRSHHAKISRVLGGAQGQVYSREEVRRMLNITERQLRSWEKQNLIPRQQTFVFSDLIALRTLVGLRANRVSTSQIRRAVAAIREKLSGVSDPLKELKIISEGKKITVQVAGGKMDPMSGQLLLDFDQEELKKMLSFPRKAEQRGTATSAIRQFEAVLWFEKALDMEQAGAPIEDVIETYQKAIELDPKSAGALVNLGTVYFHLRNWPEAERHYRRALDADSGYALAHFNLGNLFDEKGDMTQALMHYLVAIRLNPNYGDAHYNLALLYQGSGQVMRAVRHWKAYLKLDSTSPWAAIARQELEKLRKATIVTRSKPKSKGSGAESVS